MPRIDPVTADRVRQVLLAARARGIDPVAALDQAGLLDYPAKQLVGAAILMESTVIEMTTGTTGTWILAQIARRNITTPHDMYTDMIHFLRGIAEQWRKQARTPPGT